tara:strand:+ start:1884 stop:2093 length:210 start_codon:yes stop_codon:yes gene_type:complete
VPTSIFTTAFDEYVIKSFEYNAFEPIIHKSLAQVEDKLAKEVFFRTNRQQVININHVEKVVSWFNENLK